MDDITICKHTQIYKGICLQCSSLTYKKISTIKPNKYKTLFEIHPKDLLKTIQNDNNGIFISNNNIKNIELYTNYRTNALNIFKKIFRNSYRDDTFYFFVHLMDYILLKSNLGSDHFNTIALGSFILASKKFYNP
jgi:hypothetical protein